MNNDGDETVLVIATLLLDEWSAQPAREGTLGIGIVLLVGSLLGLGLMLWRAHNADIVVVALGFSMGLGTEIVLRALRFLLPTLEKAQDDDLVSFTHDAKLATLLAASALLVLAAGVAATRATTSAVDRRHALARG